MADPISPVQYNRVPYTGNHPTGSILVYDINRCLKWVDEPVKPVAIAAIPTTLPTAEAPATAPPAPVANSNSSPVTVPVQVAAPVASANPSSSSTATSGGGNQDQKATAAAESGAKASALGNQTIENKPAINTSPVYNPPVYPKTPTNGPAPSTGNNNNGVLIITGGRFKDSPISNNAISGGGLLGSVKIDGPKEDAQNDKSTKTNTGNNQPVTRQQNVGNKTKTETPPVIPGAGVSVPAGDAVKADDAAKPAAGGAAVTAERKKVILAVLAAANKAGLKDDQKEAIKRAIKDNPDVSVSEALEFGTSLDEATVAALVDAAKKSEKPVAKP